MPTHADALRDGLTYQQRVVLDKNPTFELVGLFPDGDALVLDHQVSNAGLALNGQPRTWGPYVITLDGRVQGIYHHYSVEHVFTLRRFYPAPETAAEREARRWPAEMTCRQAQKYLLQRFNLRYHPASIGRWCQAGKLDARLTPHLGRLTYLIRRASLDHAVLWGKVGQDAGHRPRPAAQKDEE